jgi:pilus assembly protein CpaC
MFAGTVDLVLTLVQRDGDTFALFLQSLEANSLAKVLAEPRLVARSGQLASFLAGGEVPIPVPQDDDTIAIQFKRFGVQLEFIPTVLSSDRIHLQVTPEVSQPLTGSNVIVSGISVPTFATRRVSTGVELADGQSFMIGGLLQDQVMASYERYPLLGSVPVLGNLFRSQTFMRNQSELVVIVTPRLVQPLGPGPFPLPTDLYREPGAWAFYLLGRINARPLAPPAPVPGSGSSAEPGAASPVASTGATQEGLLGDFGHQLRLRQPQGGE